MKSNVWHILKEYYDICEKTNFHPFWKRIECSIYLFSSSIYLLICWYKLFDRQHVLLYCCCYL